jgi:predicted ribosomally synthesized peptide with nif11-like leader
MNAEMQRFTNDLASNAALRATVKAAGTDYPSIVKAANQNGYQFTLSDVNAVMASGELSDAQLEGVAGGAGRIWVWRGGAFIEVT